jgi:hypothetical protein
MVTWNEVQAATPALARRVQTRFDAHLHKVMATLRADGSPRISATEAHFRDGELFFGSMPRAVKARDLQRDPRVALHSAPVDAEMSDGDAKISGRAIEVTNASELAAYAQGSAPEGTEPVSDFHLFRVDVDEIVLTTVDQERQRLVVESWNVVRGLRRAERT